MTAKVSHESNDAAQDAQGFASLGLNQEIMKAVEELGYTAPTPVQAGAIPEVLAGRDVLAAAQTGTGKTAAFLLPTMNNLAHGEKRRGHGKSLGSGPYLLVVTPTRELAQQIESVCRTVCKHTRHSSITVVGGVSYNPQRNALKRGCDILIATPGRLIDLMEQGACSLDQVQVLVLDEADRMLDMGFLPAIRTIVDATPEQRQTLLFSATLDEGKVGSITDLVKDPARIEIAPVTSTAETVEQYALPVSLEAKNALLPQVLKKAGSKRVIVFTRTKHRADACRRRLVKAGISCAVIHGDRTQNQRERALRSFSAGECDVLVATDVLARGIDIADVSYVINFDVPEDPVDYIHRIGRTGRGGDVGWSLTIVTEQDIDEFNDIETLMGKTIDLYDTEGLELGEDPVYIDPDRVPASKLPGKKAKKKRRKARDKKMAAKGQASSDSENKKSSSNDEDALSEKPSRKQSGKRTQGKKGAQGKKQQSKPSRKNAVHSADAKRSGGRRGKGRSDKRSTEEVPAAFRPGVHSSGVRQAAKPGKHKRSQGGKNHRGRRNGQQR